MIAKRVFYSGSVQGVGFRYSTRQIATRFNVSGWVKNLPDGRVEVQVMGDPIEVDRFLLEICQRSHLASYIRDYEESEIATQQLQGFDGFSIVH